MKFAAFFRYNFSLRLCDLVILLGIRKCVIITIDISNFSCTSESAAKAGKAVFPIVVGQATNLYRTFKPSHGRNSQRLKTISLDLHGMSKDEALQTLHKNLPRWINLAMNGGDPWVIPVDIICGGGNQILREVVAAWIKRENQVGNRPKNYHRI